MSDTGVEEKGFSNGDVARYSDTDETVRADGLKAEVEGDNRRTEHPVACTQTEQHLQSSEKTTLLLSQVEYSQYKNSYRCLLNFQ